MADPEFHNGWGRTVEGEGSGSATGSIEMSKIEIFCGSDDRYITIRTQIKGGI